MPQNTGVFDHYEYNNINLRKQTVQGVYRARPCLPEEVLDTFVHGDSVGETAAIEAFH